MGVRAKGIADITRDFLRICIIFKIIK